MSNCIDAALSAGKITKELADRLKTYDNLDEALEIETLNLSRTKREAAIQAVRITEGWEKVKSHKDGPYYGLMALMARDKKDAAGYMNVDALSKVYEYRFHSRFADALSAFRTKSFGLTQDKEGLLKLIKAIYGETVDDPEIMKICQAMERADRRDYDGV